MSTVQSNGRIHQLRYLFSYDSSLCQGDKTNQHTRLPLVLLKSFPFKTKVGVWADWVTHKTSFPLSSAQLSRHTEPSINSDGKVKYWKRGVCPVYSLKEPDHLIPVQDQAKSLSAQIDHCWPDQACRLFEPLGLAGLCEEQDKDPNGLKIGQAMGTV